MIGHVITCQLIQVPFDMGKRKAKTTLTKIDLSVLEPKQTAFSYHAAHDGTRVTTTLKPVFPPLEDDAFLFNADLADFNEECFEDDGDETVDTPRGYYVARVRVSS